MKPNAMFDQVTATHWRQKVAEMEQSYTLLHGHPHLQAEKIAEHYTSLVSMTAYLRKLLDERRARASEYTPELDALIERMVGDIKFNHLKDFGLLLDWSMHPKEHSLIYADDL